MQSLSALRQPGSKIGREALKLVSVVRGTESQPILNICRTPWTCHERTVERRVQSEWSFRRNFSTTARRRDNQPTQGRKPIDPLATVPPTTSEPQTPASSSSSLPSHTDNRRSDLSKQTSRLIDSILARASLASQHINAYTGTDYSGIDALRKEIIEQEQKVKNLHSTVDVARSKHQDAYTKQTSAQREIVGLLERKSSWSQSDLDRYMSLVRSEHLNDQDVQVSKENLTVAERDLEECRSLLERLERKQYHEEQIWSDTIRRNSTWVTFGLMGVNIVLLLAQIAIFEPYRRKKIVKDVKNALDEKTLIGAPAVAGIERHINAAFPPQNVTAEGEIEKPEQPTDGVDITAEKNVGSIPLSAGEMLPGDASKIGGSPLTSQDRSENPLLSPTIAINGPRRRLEAIREAVRDLFSERLIHVRKIDVTNTALQGAAAGIATMGVLFAFLWPR